jgi:Xaa-Pro aminopeptidase
MKSNDTLLMLADSDHDANMLYRVGMFVPDPFIFLEHRGRRHLVMSDLEIDRARKEAPGCKVHPLRKYQEAARKNGVARPTHTDVIPLFLRELGVRKVMVPSNFPLGVAEDLRARGLRVAPVRDPLFPERECKSAQEVRHLIAALRIAEVGMAAGLAALKESKPGKNRVLTHRGEKLTSERLRGFIDAAIAQAGGVASHTIVAGGLQGCDPHECGHGPLKADEPIIVDIFPRASATGYFGDITRTFVRGKASEAARKLFATVFEGQALAIKMIRAGIPTASVHAAVQQYFVGSGYKTGQKKGRMQGYFHGTGHGLGLEIHEPPRMGPNSGGDLKVGQVVTVEPGLYYPGIGGVRLEDVVVVKSGGCTNITQFEKLFEV